MDSHGQTRGAKIYTLRVYDKRIHPRLKAWSSVCLASLVGIYTVSTASMKGRPGYPLAGRALLLEGATHAPIIETPPVNNTIEKPF